MVYSKHLTLVKYSTYPMQKFSLLVLTPEVIR